MEDEAGEETQQVELVVAEMEGQDDAESDTEHETVEKEEQGTLVSRVLSMKTWLDEWFG